jgi:hypothetical protein
MRSQLWKTSEPIKQFLIKTFLARATELERVVLTLNRKDFKRLHKQNSNHAGIIICTEDADRSGQARRISERISKTENLDKQLVRVYRPNK